MRIITEVPLSERKKAEALFFMWLLTDQGIGLVKIVSTKKSAALLRDVANLHEQMAKGQPVSETDAEELQARLRRAGTMFEKAGNEMSSTALMCAYCSTSIKAENRLDAALSWADNAHAYYGGGGFAMPIAACEFFEKAVAKALEICRDSQVATA